MQASELVMKYLMPYWLKILARNFPGTRISIANFTDIQNATYCEFGGINFHFDKKFMDRKRFVALAAGAIEIDEITVAQKFLNDKDIIVEFGSGLGIAAARVNAAIKPQKHYCFEANPAVIEYSQKLFNLNNMDIQIENYALGDGSNLPFYALDDYLLSSFQKPKNNPKYRKIDVPTIKCQDVLEKFQPTAIFCDVEGAELEYLNASNFGKTKTIIAELHPHIYGDKGVENFYKNIEDHGFKAQMTKGNTHCFLR